MITHFFKTAKDYDTSTNIKLFYLNKVYIIT